jgi:anhydro-N-acetylmuramic acid kinase
MDAVDSALVEISNTTIRLLEYEQQPISENIRKELKELTRESSIDQVSHLDIQLGRLFADTALSLLKKSGVDRTSVMAIGSHGQTVLHRAEGPEPSSLQIADPNTIAYVTGTVTVSDFRGMDMAAGGQGAPLAPLFHAQVFQQPTMDRIVLNIGGMTNITWLPATERKLPVLGFDTGPGNVLLDSWARRNTSQDMDRDGVWAATGNVDDDLLCILLDDNYFRLPPPKSTGRDYFNIGWLENKLKKVEKNILPHDIQATLTCLTASTIAAAIKNFTDSSGEILVCGGGVHNPQLMQHIHRQLSDYSIMTTTGLGINPDAIEAMCFAWLARCRLEGIPGNLPSVTGARISCVLGGIYTADGNDRSGKP